MNILKEAGYPHLGPVITFEDNTSTIRASENPVEHSKLKHLEINYHAIREFIELGQICTIHITTLSQLADLLTKNHSPLRHEQLRTPLLNMVPIYSKYSVHFNNSTNL